MSVRNHIYEDTVIILLSNKTHLHTKTNHAQNGISAIGLFFFIIGVI